MKHLKVNIPQSVNIRVEYDDGNKWQKLFNYIETKQTNSITLYLWHVQYS